MIMLRISNNLKIFDSIIKCIAIFMVDMFIFFKWSAKIFLHYTSMFKYSYPVMSNRNISFGMKRSSSIWSFYCMKSSMIQHSSIMHVTKTFSNYFIITLGNRALRWFQGYIWCPISSYTSIVHGTQPFCKDFLRAVFNFTEHMKIIPHAKIACNQKMLICKIYLNI